MNLLLSLKLNLIQETYDQGPMSFTQVNLNQNKWQGDIDKIIICIHKIS